MSLGMWASSVSTALLSRWCEEVCAGQLRELSLQGVPRGAGLFDDKDKRENLLPRLQVCYLKQCGLDELLPIILMVAPKLEELNADLEVNDVALFSRNIDTL